MNTIVQEYGPIYGEVVNGTVQGRPNGSVYVPLSNRISLSIPEISRYVKYYNVTSLILCKSDGTDVTNAYGYTVVALAQDLSSNIRLQVYSDAELTTLVAYRNLTQGNFNGVQRAIQNASEGLEDGDTLYIRAQLMNNDVAVATSEVIEVTMVVPE